MNVNNTTKKITETSVMVALMVIFAFMGYSILPMISIIYPVPAIVTGYKNGTKYSVLAVVASGLTMAVLTDLFTTVFIVLVYGSISIVITYLINKKRKSFEILIGGGVTFLISALLAIFIIQKMTGIGLVNEIQMIFEQSIDMQYGMMESMGLSNYELLKVKDKLKETMDYIIMIIPAVIMITAVFTTYVNYWISIFVLKRMGDKELIVPNFKNFRLPSNIILGIAVIVGATFILKYTNLFYHESIVKNIAVLTIIIFFMQGLALVTFFMEKRNTKRLIRILMMILMITYTPMVIIVTMIGLFDSIFNFRKITKINKKD